MSDAASPPTEVDGQSPSPVHNIGAYRNGVDASGSDDNGLSGPGSDGNADSGSEDEVAAEESASDDQSDNGASDFEMHDAASSEEEEFGGEGYNHATKTVLPSHHAGSTIDYASDGSHVASGSDDSSQRGIKRKSSVEDDDFILRNPKLYGLRRSERARPTRQTIIDSDSESEPPSKRRRSSKEAGSAKRSSLSPSPNVLSDSSDSYSGSSRRIPTVRPRRNQRERVRNRRSSSASTPAHAEVRFSTRTSHKIVSYKEDDDDELFGDVDLTLPMDSTMDIDDTTPAIEKVLDHRFKSDVNPTKPDLDRADCDFFIKWQGKAHYHATWETDESLEGCRSMRRLDNYVRTKLADEISFLQDPRVTVDDRERWNLKREQEHDQIEACMKVDRVIASREVDGDTEYYVKWKQVSYSYCTWETSMLVSEIAQSEIDQFLDRCSRPLVSDKAQSNLATRTKPQEIKTTPDYIKHGTLKDFQMHGLNFLTLSWWKGRNVILADEMGLGKTIQTVAFINWLRHEGGQNGPFIVVIPLSTLSGWTDTFDNWTPDVNYVVYHGGKASLDTIHEHELFVNGDMKRPKFNVLLTTYEMVNKHSAFLSQIKWQFLAVDEAHRLKNRDSQLYANLQSVKAPCRLFITGTPVQNNLSELKALMDFLNPGAIEIDEYMDLKEDGAGEKLATLTSAIKPYMIRRTKNKVEKDLPPKTEKILRVELSDLQLSQYQNILTRNYTALNAGGEGQKTSLLNIVMELKKCSNHLFLFPNAEARILQGVTSREDYLRALITSSGKMMLLDRLMTKLKKDGHRVLVFSQMCGVLDIISDYMEARGYNHQRISGSVQAAQRRTAIDHFNAPNSSDFAFLLSTRAGGLGINLMTADVVIIFDSDWNPQADLQAMCRAHRIGQTKPVSVYRFVSSGTIEEDIVQTAKDKLLLEFATIQQGVTDKEATDLKDKFTRAGKRLDEPTKGEELNRLLKGSTRRIFTQSGQENKVKLEQLDIDTVLQDAEINKSDEAGGMEINAGQDFLKAFDFVDVEVDEVSWDDIIPKDKLEQIKADEEKRQEEEFLRQKIEESKPRKRKSVYNDGDGDDGDDDDDDEENGDNSREERSAKRRARKQVKMGRNDSPSRDPSRPLIEKEYRNLFRAFLRYGEIEAREQEIVRAARLEGRNINLVMTTLKELCDAARQVVEEDKAQYGGKLPPKKDKKAPVFEHRGVGRLNAETIVDRPIDMRIVRKATSSIAETKNFRIPEATKGADYTCSWGAREDGMLVVGIARHGYGAWTQIRDDPDLGLTDKLFLEEHQQKVKNERGQNKPSRTPGPVHLGRRADYLISVLKNKAAKKSAAKRAAENSRVSKKTVANSRIKNKGQSVSASPAPSAARRVREQERSRKRPSPGTPVTDSSRIDAKRQRLEKPGRRSSGSHDDMSREDMMKAVFEPVHEHISRVANINKTTYPNKHKRAAEVRRHLVIIGKFVEDTMKVSAAIGLLPETLWYVVGFLFLQVASTEPSILTDYGSQGIHCKLVARQRHGCSTSDGDAPEDSR